MLQIVATDFLHLIVVFRFRFAVPAVYTFDEASSFAIHERVGRSDTENLA